MKVYNTTEDLPVFKNPVITTGTFDGVHLGHVQIIRQLVAEAKKINGTPVVITFYPHPKQVIEENRKPIFVLNTPEEKYDLLNRQGIENIVCVPFNKTFSELPASDYIKQFLVEKFHPHTIITGYDHRFGMNREGDYNLLLAESSRYNYKVMEIPEHVLQSVVISSTKIREALVTGAVETANEFLGYPYLLTGKVVEGKKLGRTLGFPTANLDITEANKLIPALGIYAVRLSCSVLNGDLKGMMSIGTNPTVGGTERTIEVNIFDLDQDIYGSTISVSIIKRLRSEVNFETIEQLKSQMLLDKENVLKVFGV